MPLPLIKIIQALHWRYAVKIFNPKKKLAAADLNALLEAARLSPSSLGLLPYKIVVVENSAARKLIFEQASNQSKITEASHLLVFCTYRSYTRSFIDAFVDMFSKERHLSPEQTANLRKARRAFVKETSPKDLDEWAGDQAFIGLGILLASAAMVGIDAGPMGGFKPEVLDEILNLRRYNLRSRVLCALGYRSAEDAEAKAKKVRWPFKDFVIKIK